ncbi:MAG: hypothetical protein HUJ51_00500 [Eggerthellaceae bacterium]|nr:hypothetical protein [Eggerthellaceae bacterium]
MHQNDRYLYGVNFVLHVGGFCVIGAQAYGASGIWVGAESSDRQLWVVKLYKLTFFLSSLS